MERDEFTCRHCRSKGKTLNVHHHFYKKGAMPWDYEDIDLITLCENCHEILERQLSFVTREISRSRSLLGSMQWFLPMMQIGTDGTLFEVGHYLSQFMESIMTMNMGMIDMDDDEADHDATITYECSQASEAALGLVEAIAGMKRKTEAQWWADLDEARVAKSHPK